MTNGGIGRLLDRADQIGKGGMLIKQVALHGPIRRGGRCSHESNHFFNTEEARRATVGHRSWRGSTVGDYTT